MSRRSQPSGKRSINDEGNIRTVNGLTVFCLLLMLCLGQQLSAAPLTFNLPEGLSGLEPNPQALINNSARKRLGQIFQLLEQAENSAALEETQSLINEYAHHPVIVSHGLSAAAQILAQQGQTDAAISLLNQVIQLKSLDLVSMQEKHLMLARFYLQQENYLESLPLLENWLAYNRKHEARAEVYYLVAFTQYQLGRYQQAIASAEQALTEHYKDPTALLAIQFNSAFNMEDYGQAERFAARLVQNKPQIKSYWRNWIAALSQQKKHSQALAMTELLRQQHLLEPAEILNYVYLLLDQKLPARAARQMEQSLASGELEDSHTHRLLLASAWQQAGELDKAIRTIEAQKQLDAESLVRLISLYSEKADWSSLLRLAESNSKQLDSNEWVQMQVFHALYQTEQIEDAITLLIDLARNAENQQIKSKAQQWLAYLRDR